MFENICIGGCGWAVSFYVGVYKALVEVYGYDNLKTWNVCCVSGSSGISIAIATGTTHEHVDTIFKKVHELANIYGTTNSFPGMTHLAIDCLFHFKEPYIDQLNPRFHVAVSELYNKLVIKNNFTDDKELFKYLHSTAHIPFYTTSLESINLSNLDAGFTCNLPKFKERTLYVSVADREAHINLTDQLSTLDMIYANSPDRYEDLKQIGYHRTKDFLETYNKTKIAPTVKHYHNKFIPAFAWVCFRYDKYVVIKSKLLLKKLIMQFLKQFDKYILTIAL